MKDSLTPMTHQQSPPEAIPGIFKNPNGDTPYLDNEDASMEWGICCGVMSYIKELKKRECRKGVELALDAGEQAKTRLRAARLIF